MKYVPPLDATDTNAPYVDGNPAAGIEGSIVAAASIEHPMREILAVILGAGLTPSATILNQLWQAINKVVERGIEEIDLSAYAKLDSPAFIGSPEAPTPDKSDNSTHLATTAFVKTLVSSGAYSHPVGGAANRGTGLYKFATDSTSHILSLTPVTKADLTALGVSGSDTTYSLATASRNGLMSAADKSKLDSLSGAGARAWSNMTSSRSINTTYTNTTGREIMVHVGLSVGGGVVATLQVGGVDVSRSFDVARYYDTVVAAVPAGSTYKVAGGSLLLWMELK
jgi:hypothetical protein